MDYIDVLQSLQRTWIGQQVVVILQDVVQRVDTSERQIQCVEVLANRTLSACAMHAANNYFRNSICLAEVATNLSW